MRKLVFGVTLFFGTLVVFYLSLVLVNCIPASPMQDNLAKSTEILINEGNYPSLSMTSHSGQLDNATTATMLNISGHRGASPFSAALLGEYYSTPGASSIECLSDSIDKPPNESYSRYWHGYTILLKPLLLCMSLLQIRGLFCLIMAILLSGNIILMSRKLPIAYSILFVTALFLCNLPVATLSLPLAFSFFVALTGTMIVLCKVDSRKPLFSEMRFGVTFFFLGAATVFLDFLDTPIITLGIPLLVYLAAKRSAINDGSIKKLIGGIATCCFAWGGAYFGLFAAKILLAILVAGPDAFKSHFEQILFRVRGETEIYDEISASAALALNFQQLCTPLILLVLMSLGIAYAVILLKRRHTLQTRIEFKTITSLSIVGLFPVIWYVILANHSIIHFWFTYRNLAVTMICIFFIALCLLGLSPNKTDKKQKIEAQTTKVARLYHPYNKKPLP